MSSGGGQRRLSDLLSAVPRASVGSSLDTTLAADEELLVPRLVARIAELEEKLYSDSAGHTAGAVADGGLLDRFGGLLKRAQQGIDAGISYVVGDSEAQQAQLSAVTKEATAKALLITIKKLQGLKAEKQRLEEAAASLELELESARTALHEAQAAASAAAEAEAAARAATTSDAQEAAAQAAAAAEAAAADRRALADATAALEALRVEAAAAQADGAEAQQRVEALGGQVAALQDQLAAAHSAAAELQRQLDGSRTECEALQARLAQADEEMAGERAEAEALRGARAALAQELNETKSRLERAQAAAEDFQRRFLQERLERRKVHEQLQVLRGNIRVCCRVRPCLSAGAGATAATAQQQSSVSFPYPGSLCLHATERRQQEFEFDSVFSGDSSQAEVFDEVWPLIRSCADGYNVCLLAYGQTGSGKTHTMMGPEQDPGLSVRALQALFDITATEAEGGHRRTISVSMLEVYNEALRDLLAAGAEAAKLDVSAMGAGQLAPGQERVPGLTWRAVGSVADVLAVLAEGSRNRATAATSMNAHSSRSHALLSVRLTDEDGQSSVLHLVDLAGSERIAKSEVVGQQLKEAQAINKSLSALGDVIASLQSKSGHVPYRNSKLTQVLQDSLCGSSKVLLVCCISPEAASAQESLSSLNFASRAAQVELGPIRKANEQGTPGGAARRQPASGPAAGQSPLTPGALAAANGARSKLAGTPQSGLKQPRSALRDANAH
ncbi:kinesin KIFC3 isoform X3 isoform B [Chlorella sorokiniana]|uniref:Kinesin-like protein n=1 Tax=Chlorella sorokiniana TaxID=3076 RepID=A0A2P6TEL9_CHLSO|nr:kinesin KIFC3 isoform X3 isoform A [Chlorella sorokiniana]PRW21081.1 kinesin KIFC3 isoform X3 isoform B [Chlorella sorokiniana]|eukprot:PRW21080.1 kinesin KIFC3 isoform X3 isoform A [Chlorella sorokiniana]